MNNDGLNLLQGMDYSVLQQCMHCGMCLPACPTYTETLNEKSSPRGRIGMMRAIADERRPVNRAFAEEMYFCLGCLACQTACPAGVDYAMLFETARSEIERSKVLDNPKRNLVRQWALRWLFMRLSRLRILARLLRLYQRSGIEYLVHLIGFFRLFPQRFRELEQLTPRISSEFTSRLHKQKNNPKNFRYRVALLSGCVQDIAFAETNAATIEVLQKNGCHVSLPPDQGCCGSLHAHNGDSESARILARKNIDSFVPETLDAIIVNAGGCGSHLIHYEHLLQDDGDYFERAKIWSNKVRDVQQFLIEIGFREPTEGCGLDRITYHESCHLKHGQKVSEAPRAILRAIPGLELVELFEADTCCGSAGIYNITQPQMSMQLLDRKMGHIVRTGSTVVATGNPGCAIQLVHGGKRIDQPINVVHPVQLLAAAYRAEV